MKDFQSIKFLSHTYKFYWFLGYCFYGKGSTSPCITVHFCKDNACEFNVRIKFLCNVDSILPRHTVCDQEFFIHRDIRDYIFKLFHQFLIYVETPGSVNDDYIKVTSFSLLQGFFACDNRRNVCF